MAGTQIYFFMPLDSTLAAPDDQAATRLDPV
jgi:hypothetical protein